MVNQEKQVASIWLDSKVTFENIPLKPGFALNPAVSFSAGAGKEEVIIDDLRVSIMNLSDKDSEFITLFKEDFERLEEGRLPENSGWETTKIKVINGEKSGNSETVLIDDTKALKIKSIEDKEVIVVKHLNPPGNFPFDISDKPFEIRYNDTMANDVSPMESVETDTGHGPYGGAVLTNTSATLSSPTFSRTQSGGMIDTYYIYSHDGKLLAEYDQNGTCVRDYIYSGNRLIAEYKPQTNTYYYYMSDQINTTRIISDGNGNVVYSALYGPYGEVQKVWTNTYDPKLKFSGKEREGYSDLDYFGARYYDHNSYRFISVDPIINKTEALVNPQLWNLYTYCRNNPVTYLDPDGREPNKSQVIGPSSLIAYIKSAPGITARATLAWLGTYSTAPGRFGGANPKNKRYIYTEKAGWIDLAHFFGVAAELDKLSGLKKTGAWMFGGFALWQKTLDNRSIILS